MKKKKPYKTKHPKKSVVNEPRPSYANREVEIFKSFEEMEKQDAKEMAELTPVQHLQHVTEYIMYAYAKDLKYKMKDMTIRFKKTEDGDTAA